MCPQCWTQFIIYMMRHSERERERERDVLPITLVHDHQSRSCSGSHHHLCNQEIFALLKLEMPASYHSVDIRPIQTQRQVMRQAIAITEYKHSNESFLKLYLFVLLLFQCQCAKVKCLNITNLKRRKTINKKKANV